MHKKPVYNLRLFFTGFVIAISLLIVVLIFPARLVLAADPVKLVIGESGAEPWNELDVIPGQSGTKIITVKNNGIVAGNLTIWVSDIVNIEGTPSQFQPDPGQGDLVDYIVFSVVSERLNSNIAMPALIGDLPQNASDSNYIKAAYLASGETITIYWHWELSATAGNIVQGDSLTFTINYMLVQAEPLPTTTSTPHTSTVTPPTTTTEPVPPTTIPPTTASPTTTPPTTTPPTTMPPTTVPPTTPLPPTTTIPTDEWAIAGIDDSQPPTAFDEFGNLLSFTDNLITVSKQGNKLVLSIPITLQEGNKLQSLADSVGLAYQNNELLLPASSITSNGRAMLQVFDDFGELETTFIITTSDFVGSGSKAIANIISIRTVSGFAVKDFTKEDPYLGEVASSISLELDYLPDSSKVKIATRLGPGENANGAFQLVAIDAGMGVISVAYVIDIEKTNLENKTDIKSATVTMIADREWVEANGGIEAIRIIRYDPDNGGKQVLDTTFQGYDDKGRAIFKGYSPDGLSIFGLVGEKPDDLTLPTNFSWWWLSILLVAAIVLVIFWFILFKKQQQEGEKEQDNSGHEQL